MPILECSSSIHQLVASLDHIKNKNYLTHNIHPYPAKFIPQIPACLIENYSKKNDVIFDPFCGSGSTLLEAIIRDRKAIGLDLNPIATLISKVKVTSFNHLEKDNVLSFLQKLDEALMKIHMNPNWLHTVVSKKDIPCFYNINHWFQANVQFELAFIKKLVLEHECTNLTYDFLMLCLSAIIVRVSNQESDTRWAAMAKNIKDGFTISCYKDMITTNLDKIMQLSKLLSPQKSHVLIITGNAEEIPAQIKQDSIDLIVTSPPYLNSYDYYLYHKLRMFWLGYDHKIVQAQEIGSRNKHCDKQESIATFTKTITTVLNQLSKVLKPAGICSFVVGDAIYRGKLVQMDSLYEEIVRKSGFKLIDKASFEQRKYSKSFTPNLKKGHKESHILILERK